MYFPWNDYEEIASNRKNTLQVFITTRCNLKCNGCFAKNVMGEKAKDISLKEYSLVIDDFLEKDGKQINILGGEPLLHPKIREIVQINRDKNIKTTIYTNGSYLNRFNEKDFENAKLRLSLYCKSGKNKSLDSMIKTDFPIDVCFMVSSKTTKKELVETADELEKNYNTNVFFISSIRELDNPRKEFFDDTELSMNVLAYKELVHEFLQEYKGNMEIHISKRGVFESTKTIAGNKCKFANYFIGGKIIQCPYDTINLKFQKDYLFDTRNCQQNNSCLMSKIVVKRKS
ncbi:MAG: 4Fe-4S cluster-binding domain-containing protein [Nanoarchaeota archaeon]|nr:4Fe-4S cluster-binding domain-containing protein [Nanoarchaeota archaeon]